MQPSDTPVPVGYLDQIAPEQKPSGFNNQHFFAIIIGAVVVILIAIVLMVAASAGPSDTDKLQSLGLRLQSLQTIADDAQKNIQSSDLRSTNGNLSTYLVNTNRDIAPSLTKAKINLKKAVKKASDDENGKTLTAKLEDARLNAVFDRTYAREMAYQLESISLSMKTLRKTTKSKTLKAFIDGSSNDLATLQKQFADFKDGAPAF